MNDPTPTSFDALAAEHNLTPRIRDLCRIFFKAGLEIGKKQTVAMRAPAADPVGRRPGEQPKEMR